MKVRETELPGTGHKAEMITRNNEKLAIITHDDGRREKCIIFKRTIMKNLFQVSC